MQEFVPEYTFKSRGLKALELLDERMIRLAEFDRLWFDKPVIINNWDRGGQRQYSGWRPRDMLNSSQLSQHYAGRAYDKVQSDPESEFDEIKKYPLEWFNAGLHAIENIKDTPTWVHKDVRLPLFPSIQVVGVTQKSYYL